MLRIGIVGLPNVGKSTLFNALLKVTQAQAGNFPFTTIEPNVGMVAVPDERLDQLAVAVQPEKITPAAVRFVDIAGLVRGAHQGEGLGNQFLSHIREVDAIAMVVRFFADPNVTHVAGKIDPADDIRTIQLELILADLKTVQKRLDAVTGKSKTGDKQAQLELTALQKISQHLENEGLVCEQIAQLSEDEQKIIGQLQLLTNKQFLYVANVDEAELAQAATFQKKLTEITGAEINQTVVISAKIEAELAELSEHEQTEFLNELGLREPGRNQLIRQAYVTLGLMTYFTAGPQEVRAWTVPVGATAPQAAGEIHTDFTRGFIAAETISWAKFLEAGGWSAAKSKGWVRTEGKTYVVQDGDVMLFRFNV